MVIRVHKGALVATMFGNSRDHGRIVRGENQGWCARAAGQISHRRVHPTVDPLWWCCFCVRRIFGMANSYYKEILMCIW